MAAQQFFLGYMAAKLPKRVRRKGGGGVGVSEKGRPVTLRSPWASHASISVVVSSSGTAVQVRSMGNGLFLWDTQPGVTYAVAPK